MRTPDGASRTAVMRDASDGGAFLLTGGDEVEPGASVELEVVGFRDGTEPASVRGRVLRARPWDSGDLWRLAVAVCFETALPASVAIAEIAARQASWA